VPEIPLRDAAGTRLREPELKDGSAIWSLVCDTGVLDLNSSYSYFMLCKFFHETCVVAEEHGNIVGFVSAFRLPQENNAVFVWQIAVAESQRGKGLASAMLMELLGRKSCQDISFVLCTISPSNRPSQALFRKLARDLQTKCEVSRGIPASLFPGGTHDDEDLYRIGPIRRPKK